MATPLELTETDFKLLNYINKFDSVTREQLITNFPKINALDYRLNLLSNMKDLSKNGSSERYIIEKISFEGVTLKSSGIFTITDLGRKALQDYLFNKRKASRKSKFEWIRYIVTTSIAIAALINSILARLGL